MGIIKHHTFINYTQLGLAFTLHSFEILYNLGIATLLSGDLKNAAIYFCESCKLTLHFGDVVSDFNAFDGKAGEGMICASTMIYEPKKDLVTNIKSIDYLGEACVLLDLEDVPDMTDSSSGECASNSPISPYNSDNSREGTRFDSIRRKSSVILLNMNQFYEKLRK